MLPFRFVGMGEHDALERHRAEILGAGVIAFLRRGQQRVQHLDRRLEHLDEFQQPLRRAVEAAGIAVGVGIVLREMLQLADVDLADQRGDVLVVLVAGLGLGDADLAQLRRDRASTTENFEMSPSNSSSRLAAQGEQTPVSRRAGNSVRLLQQRAHRLGTEQAERRFEDRADFVAGREHIDRLASRSAPSAARRARICRRQPGRADRGSACAPRDPARRAGRS